MNTGKILLGILGAAAVGAVLGILFAPEDGKKTRKKIFGKGNDFTGEIKGKVEDLYHNIKTQQANLLENTKDLATNKK